MDKLALIDLDKVVSNSSVRFAQATYPDGRINWKIALNPTLVDTDTLIEGVDTALDVIAVRGYHIIFVTGRPENMRQATVDWLVKYGLTVHEMIMRPDGDFTKAPDFKHREVARIIAEMHPEQVLFIDDLVDDHPQLLTDIVGSTIICHASLADYMLYSSGDEQ